MRRWNGWGDDTIQYPLSARALAFLRETVGETTPPRDVSADDVLATIPATRLKQLPGRELISVEEWPRLLHTRGQSLPDWVALRSGCIPAFPDGVAFPRTQSDVGQGFHAGSFSTIIRVFDAGRVGGHAIQWPAIARLWSDREPLCGRNSRGPSRRIASATFPSLGRRARRAAAGARLRRTAGPSERRDGSHHPFAGA